MLVYDGLFGELVVHLSQGGGAVVTLYHLTACVDDWRTLIGGRSLCYLLRNNVLRNLFCCHLAGFVGALFWLCFGNEIAVVACAVDMAWLQRSCFHHFHTPQRLVFGREHHLVGVSVDTSHWQLPFDDASALYAVTAFACVGGVISRHIGNALRLFTLYALRFGLCCLFCFTALAFCFVLCFALLGCCRFLLISALFYAVPIVVELLQAFNLLLGGFAFGNCFFVDKRNRFGSEFFLLLQLTEYVRNSGIHIFVAELCTLLLLFRLRLLLCLLLFGLLLGLFYLCGLLLLLFLLNLSVLCFVGSNIELLGSEFVGELLCAYLLWL